jgi:hypothetical protein
VIITDPTLRGGPATGLMDGSDGEGDRRSSAREDRDMHLLRLSLDLQLDAMLLVLGASAAGTPDAGIPWRRWLDEDVELAWELTTTAFAVRAALPPTLGADVARSDPDTLAEDLIARYESMRGLLADLVGRDSGEAPAWHAHIRNALRRCEERVDVLRDRKHGRWASVTTREPAQVDSARVPSRHAHEGKVYLPGELLG